MAQDAIAYITDKYIKLTDVEKRLADYIISNYDMAVNLSVQALAENANVSPAAVVRFARQMGFDGYKAFRLFLVANRPAHEDFILDLKKERGTVETQVEKVINANIEAMRLTEESLDYSIPEDFYRWRGSKFHWDDDLEAFVQGFLETDQELALCQLVGHSYDLDVMDLWDTMDQICRWISESDEVWAATHLALVQYLRSMDLALITEQGISNHSTQALWFAVDGKTIKLQPSETISLV